MFFAMSVDCPKTLIKQSVVAKHASAILELVFNLDFVFTAIMTSPFNKLVTGAVIILMIIKKTVTTLASVPGGGTLGISGWGCAARSLEPLTFTRASSAEFCYPILE